MNTSLLAGGAKKKVIRSQAVFSIHPSVSLVYSSGYLIGSILYLYSTNYSMKYKHLSFPGEQRRGSDKVNAECTKGSMLLELYFNVIFRIQLI